MKENEAVILEGNDAFLDAFCMQYNTSIVLLDHKLAELPDANPNKAELMRYRRQLAAANAKNDLVLVDAWLNALIVGLKAACHTIPLALIGQKFSPGRKKGAKGKFRILIEQASEVAGSRDWKSVVQALEGFSYIVQEVDWSEEKIYLLGENSARSFKTVKNQLAKL